MWSFTSFKALSHILTKAVALGMIFPYSASKGQNSKKKSTKD